MITAILPVSDGTFHRQLSASPLVRKILVAPPQGPPEGLLNGRVLHTLLQEVQTRHILLLQQPEEIFPDDAALGRLLDAAVSTGSGLVYSDHYDIRGGERQEHPVNDYQMGSIRDTFDFGPLLLLSTTAARRAVARYGALPEAGRAGLYDLRLKVSLDHPLLHLEEFLYGRMERDGRASGEKGFDYVDPRNLENQRALEAAVTAHLKRLGAYLEPRRDMIETARPPFSVEASIVIPVRNRARTIADAVRSALGQEADFPFNVLVVDNHSTDGTTRILSGLARGEPRLRHLIPARRDLQIGGCWNEAVFSRDCGRYAVQLDSDDLYGGDDTLRTLVHRLRRGPYAMVIGSYTLVDDNLEPIPPGLVDHREWTDHNGHNNALRINGLGAPRAFDTAILRRIGFPNVGYGEDYAVALRICRDYRIGRVYESLYLCRRWPGNTDAALSVEQMNRYDAFKDKLRTIEIMARQRLNRRDADRVKGKVPEGGP